MSSFLSNVAICHLAALFTWGCVVLPIPVASAELQGDEAALLGQIVINYERERLRAHVESRSETTVDIEERWIDMVVEKQAVGEVLGVKLFRAFNRLVDPVWYYVVGIDRNPESIYRLRGFSEAEFPELVLDNLRTEGNQDKDRLLEVVAVYFDVIEGWDPGVVRSQSQLAAAQHVVSADSVSLPEAIGGLSLPTLEHDRERHRIKGFLFDTLARRLDYFEIEISRQEGFAIVARETIAGRPRIEL